MLWLLNAQPSPRYPNGTFKFFSACAVAGILEGCHEATELKPHYLVQFLAILVLMLS